MREADLYPDRTEISEERALAIADALAAGQGYRSVSEHYGDAEVASVVEDVVMSDEDGMAV